MSAQEEEKTDPPPRQELTFQTRANGKRDKEEYHLLHEAESSFVLSTVSNHQRPRGNGRAMDGTQVFKRRFGAQL